MEKQVLRIISGFCWLLFPVVLAGCSIENLELHKNKLIAGLGETNIADEKRDEVQSAQSIASSELPIIVRSSAASVDLSAGFLSSVKSAVDGDYEVAAAREEFLGKKSAVDLLESQKDFELTATFYGGIEDITDETAGVAVVVNGRRLVYDGGLLDNEILARAFEADAAQFRYINLRNERSLELSSLWVELARYEKLHSLIADRLEVLDPLIQQLEKVAEAGIGDVSQVASAQRTVSTIRIIEADISEKLDNARVEFRNAYGGLPVANQVDWSKIPRSTPDSVSDEIILSAPALRAAHSAYLAASASLQAVKLKNGFSVGFEAKAQRPFGGSEYDSDESIGLVARKTIYNGNKMAADINLAQARVDAALASVKAVYREGKRAVDVGFEKLDSIDRAILIAVESAETAQEEIDYLRKQLIIGQSTLESVLSAEARLYEAESKEINFRADQIITNLTILAKTGHIGQTFMLD